MNSSRLVFIMGVTARRCPPSIRPPFFCSALLALAAAFALSCQVGAQTAPNTFWQAQNIYQLITDRFFDGDPSNNNAEGTYAPSNPTGVHGGDFLGVEKKLDYLKSLGATAIWISPIVLNTEGQFHGYSAWNFYSVAPHWGSISNLQHLVQSAHARGLLVIDDIVVNHAGDLVSGSGAGYPAFNYPTGYALSYVNGSKTYPAPFNLSVTNPALTNLFHNYGYITNYNDTNQTMLGWLSGLNDFRTETPFVRSNMAAIYQYWIAQIGFDGYRVDTALEVDTGCWQSFCPAIHNFAATNGNSNFFIFAEVNNGNDSIVGPYTGTKSGGPFMFDSDVDYPLYWIASSVFATASGSTAQIEYHYNDVANFYDPATAMQLVTFLDNHDQPRFLSPSESNNNTNALAVALDFLYTARGIPCLYYGTEQGFYGTTDPNDREDMFAGEFKDGPDGTVSQLSSPGADNFNMTHPLFLQIAQLNNFRRLYPALSLGTHINQWKNTAGPGLFAYSRRLGTQEVFVVFNTASTTQVLTNRPLTYAAGTALVNLLNTNEIIFVTSSAQTRLISVPPTAAKIFLAQSQMLPLDPVVLTNFPAHSAANIPIASPVILHFSQPMDTNSVQLAFNVAPAVAGAFSWSPTRDTVTFTPAAGFAPSTNITVTVSNTAFAAATGKTFFASYQLLFHTAAAPPVLQFSSPATDGLVISNNVTYLLQACFTPTLTTNTAALFQLNINGVLQPSASYFLRPVGAVAGCTGLRSFLYNWNTTMPGTNIVQLVFSNSAAFLVDSRMVIVAPPLVIAGLTSNAQQVVWSSTPGVNYTVLATTNLTQPFLPVSSVIPASGLTTSFFDFSNSPPVPQKFYEIKAGP